MPAIWRLILEDAIAAYNLPSGLIFDMLRSAAAGTAGVSRRSASTPSSIRAARAAE